MKVVTLVLIALLLAACQGAPTAAPTSAPTTAAATATVLPQPTANIVITTVPTTGGDSVFSEYPPAPGDESLTRGQFFMDAVAIVSDTPGTAQVVVNGSLPTPCNQPRALVNPPDEDNRIVVELYSLTDPNQMCTQVIKPFDGAVATLTGYAPGTYQVIVNDQPAGELVVP